MEMKKDPNPFENEGGDRTVKTRQTMRWQYISISNWYKQRRQHTEIVLWFMNFSGSLNLQIMICSLFIVIQRLHSAYLSQIFCLMLFIHPCVYQYHILFLEGPCLLVPKQSFNMIYKDILPYTWLHVLVFSYLLSSTCTLHIQQLFLGR